MLVSIDEDRGEVFLSPGVRLFWKAVTSHQRSVPLGRVAEPSPTPHAVRRPVIGSYGWHEGVVRDEGGLDSHDPCSSEEAMAWRNPQVPPPPGTNQELWQNWDICCHLSAKSSLLKSVKRKGSITFLPPQSSAWIVMPLWSSNSRDRTMFSLLIVSNGKLDPAAFGGILFAFPICLQFRCAASSFLVSAQGLTRTTRCSLIFHGAPGFSCNTPSILKALCLLLCLQFMFLLLSWCHLCSTS